MGGSILLTALVWDVICVVVLSGLVMNTLSIFYIGALLSRSGGACVDVNQFNTH